MSWSDRYIGIPWRDGGRHDDGIAGLDCWGLLRAVYADRLRIDLPSWRETYATAADGALLAGVIGDRKEDWTELPLSSARPLDAVLLRKGPHHCHVGIVVAGHAGAFSFLHVDCDQPAAVARSDDRRWQRRLVGIYRNKGIA